MTLARVPESAFTQKRVRADDEFFRQPGLDAPTRALRAKAAIAPLGAAPRAS